MASADELASRAEAACRSGWPALSETMLDGWRLRFAEGHTRRANSVNPIQPSTRGLREKIAQCEASYRAERLPTIFRIALVADPGLEAALTALGYGPAEDETRVIYRDLARDSTFDKGDADLTEPAPSEEWLGVQARCTGLTEAAQRIQRKVLRALAVPAVFTAMRGDDGRLASVAFGAVHDGLVCVNLVAADPAQRRRGLSRRAVSAVLAWARNRAGAEGACLPVVATNTPAIALYESLGFTRELYRYHYRRGAR